MATVNIYLNTKESTNGERLLLLYFRYGKKQVVVSTNESINPKYWDKKNQKATSKYSSFGTLNNKLGKYKDEVRNIFRNREIIEDSLEPKDLKIAFEKIINTSKSLPESKKNLDSTISKQSLVGFITNQIESQKNSKNKNTLKTYKRCRDMLVDFEQKKWGKVLTFEDVDLDFHLSWKDFTITQYKLQDNSINKYTGIIKYFMGEASDRNLHQNYAYKSRKFNTAREAVDAIYLSEKELKTIIDYDLSDNKRLESVRDLFIIGCRTGLRFSALSIIKDQHISNDLKFFLLKKIPKVNLDLDIPIHSDVKEIFRRNKATYGYYIPKSISNQKMNDYLKEVGLLCGLTESVPVVKKVGNNKTTEFLPKHDLITCHTARRSFATNEYLAGTPVYEIMAITGHKTEKSFLTYIKIKQKQYAISLGKRWEERESKTSKTQ